MSASFSVEQLELLRAYASGKLGTRQAIEQIGLNDYADLVIALARYGLDPPKPRATPRHDAHLARARALLQPRLRHGG